MAKLPMRSRTTTKLVMCAIKQLGDSHGSTLRNITEYIAAEQNVPVGLVKRAIQTSLKRGIQFGAITRKRGGIYSLNEDFLEYVKEHRSRGSRRRRRRYYYGRRRRRRSRRRYRPRRRYRTRSHSRSRSRRSGSGRTNQSSSD